ncbi:MAG: hypothetical protein ACI89L_001315 [Phycisphaerales bacterium]|jgi:hypothetical protein
MSGSIAPPWLVFPLAGIAMIITAGYLIALREAPPAAIDPRQARLRTATGWLTLVTLPLTAYGFGVTTTADPKVFMLVWVTITALLAFIFLLASIDLLRLAAQRRRLINDHRTAIRQARLHSIQLASGVAVPVSDVSYSVHGPWAGGSESGPAADAADGPVDGPVNDGEPGEPGAGATGAGAPPESREPPRE